MLFVRLAVFLYLLTWLEQSYALSTTSANCTHVFTANGTCPDTNGIPCSTFEAFIKNSSNHITSYATLCFLSGSHVLNVANATITITNASTVAFIGLGTYIQSSIADKAKYFSFSKGYTDDQNLTFLEPTAIIECNSSAGFLFSNVTNFSLIDLTITNCGTNMTDAALSVHSDRKEIASINYVAVLMINITNLSIETTSIQNSTGYGLIGINVLGESWITGSSFVGNNQFVKDNLQLYATGTIYCTNGTSYNASAFYVNSWAKNEYLGGNVLFFYTELNTTDEPILNISSCLFSLGIDGSIGLQLNIPSIYFQSLGTGLSIFLLQTSFRVHVVLDSVISYRNQASIGGNLNFQVNPLTFDFILSNVSSINGISKVGGAFYFFINRPSSSATNANSDQLQVTDSSFSTLYLTTYDILIDLSEWYFFIKFESCNFTANVVFRRASGSPVLNENITIYRSFFTSIGCSAGIAALYTSLSVTTCSFNSFAYIYGLQSSLSIAESTFSNIFASAIMILYSHLSLTGNITFANNNNNDDSGGAIYLFYSDITLVAPTNIAFINNTATLGGAVYIQKYTGDGKCNIFLSDPHGTLDNPGIKLYFEGNTAHTAGDVLYGGDIDICSYNYNCSLTPNYSKCSSTPGYMLKVINSITSCANNSCTNSGTYVSAVSSNSRAICGCSDVVIDCSTQIGVPTNSYPGQSITFSIITVGQLNGSSPDSFLVYVCDVSGRKSTIGCTAPTSSGETSKHCSNYLYPVKGRNNQAHTIAVYLLSGSAATYSKQVTILPCPSRFGFEWENSSQVCNCSNILQTHDVLCDINTLTLRKSAESGILWIGNDSNGALAVYEHCPSDFCQIISTTFSLENQDEQCDNNRSGILCGRCIADYSAVFGSARCMQCSKEYAWVLPLIAALGIILVALLYALNFTVRFGAINSIILYANIIGPGVLALLHLGFKGGFIERFLFVFIAWLNSDLGIEVCFYGGMDTYTRTWLEILFPIYILSLVCVIVILSRWSSKIARLSEHNVPVLATLILLSYTKLFKIVIEIFTYATLDVGSTHLSSLVWLYDGNILYAQGKHIYLLAAGLLITGAFIFPYTLILTMSPCLQIKSHWKVLRWVNKLKPFIDANQAPFNDRYRYWPGVHLLIRVFLYTVFTTNSANDLNINLLAIAMFGALYCSVINILSVYKESYLNIIETFYWLNMVCLSTALLYIHNSSDEDSDIAITISTGSVFLVFVGIISFHAYRRMKSIKVSSSDTCGRLAQSNIKTLKDVNDPDGSERLLENSP